MGSDADLQLLLQVLWNCRSARSMSRASALWTFAGRGSRRLVVPRHRKVGAATPVRWAALPCLSQMSSNWDAMEWARSKSWRDRQAHGGVLLQSEVRLQSLRERCSRSVAGVQCGAGHA